MSWYKKVLCAFIFLAVLCCTHYAADAQHRVSVHYTIADGLLCNRVYGVRQDKQGYIWIATDNGAYKFDGHTFKRYSTHNGLISNDVIGIEIDGYNRIWLACFNRNLSSIYQNEIYNNCLIYKGQRLLLKSYPRMNCVINGDLYFSDERNAIVYKVSGKNEVEQVRQSATYIQIGEYYLRYNNRYVELLDKGLEPLDKYYYDNKQVGDHLLSVINDTKFIVKSADINLLGEISHNRIHLKETRNDILTACKIYYEKGRTWVLEKQDSMTELDTSFNPKQHIEIPHVKISNFFIDNDGSYWVCTHGDGVYYFPNSNIVHYDQEDGLEDNNIIDICGYKGKLYILNFNGIIQVIENGKVCKNKMPFPQKKADGAIKLVVNQHYIVLGAEKGILYVYSFKNRTWHEEKGIGSIKDIEFDNEHSLLVSTSSRVILYDLCEFRHTVLSMERSTCVKRINKDYILAGGVNYIRKIYLPENKRVLSAPLKTESIYLENTTLSDIQKYDSAIVVSTNESGIYICNYKGVYHFFDKNGLSDNNCNKIVVGTENTVWISTPLDVNSVKNNNKTGLYTVEQVGAFNRMMPRNISSIVIMNNEMYVSSTKGITQFSTSTATADSSYPSIYVSEINLSGRNMSTGLKSIMISPDSNKISVTFSAIDFISLGNIQYYYKVNGVTNGWVRSESNVRDFEGLPPGTYLLEMFALNTKKEKTNVRSLELIVLPYWWQNNIVKWLVFMIGVVLTYLLTRFFSKRNYRQRLSAEENRNRIVELELRAIKAQINPHFIFNTLNAIQYYIQSGENEKAEAYLYKMSKLIRTTLEISNELSIPVSNEIEYIENYLALESLRFGNDFSYSIQSTLPAGDENILFPAMVVQTHIENAIKHGLKPKRGELKKLRIRFYRKDNCLYCEVEDNGVGRVKTMAQSSHNKINHIPQGSVLSESKLDLYKQKTGKEASVYIEDLYENDIPLGTLVTIKIRLYE